MNSIEKLKDTVEKLNICLEDRFFGALLKYKDIVFEFNRRTNLVKVKNDIEFFVFHVADSLIGYVILGNEKDKEIIDIGSGAGLPGIPLALTTGNRFALLESKIKKVEILKEFVKILRMDNVEIINGRAEEIAKKEEYRERYDFALARAFGNCSVTLECMIPFLKIGGTGLLYQTEKTEKELSDLEKTVRMFGCEISKKIEYKFDEFEKKRVLFAIKKREKTDDRFPRRISKIKAMLS